MAESQIPSRQSYIFARPPPRETNVPYKAPRAPSNPIVRGAVLHYAGSLIGSSSFISGFLYKNTGFAEGLRLKETQKLETRYDPTVIPTATVEDANSNSLRLEDLASIGPYHSISDYNAAYISGALTPTAVVEALLPLILRDAAEPSVHSVAFLQTKVELVKKAAEESTARYKAGKPLSVLDGVPIAIKDEVDLKDYNKTLGSNMDFTNPANVTPWCVQKWIDAGAVMLGKLNMHELGLGELLEDAASILRDDTCADQCRYNKQQSEPQDATKSAQPTLLHRRLVGRFWLCCRRRSYSLRSGS